MSKNPFKLVAHLWRWLWAKRSEAAQLDYRDAYMAQLVLEILQMNTGREFVYAPLYNLRPIHPTDNRENTIQAVKKRAETVKSIANEWKRQKTISKELMAEVLPSATFIRAIEDGEGGYYTFEGNGRVAALLQVFKPEDAIEIELDLYHPMFEKQARKKIRRLRKMHKMR